MFIDNFNILSTQKDDCVKLLTPSPPHPFTTLSLPPCPFSKTAVMVLIIVCVLTANRAGPVIRVAHRHPYPLLIATE
jgi:hypothetical protein